MEQDHHILNIFFRIAEERRMKYSFLVDESTTVGLINAAMAEKLQIDHEIYQCKLVNCVPGGQGKYTVHQPKLKLKLLLKLLDYNIFTIITIT